MATISEKEILHTLGNVKDPDRGEDLVSLGMIQGLQVKEGHVAFAIAVDPERGPKLEPLRKEAEKTIHALPGVLTATVVLTAEKAPQPQAAQPQQPQQSPDVAPRGGQGEQTGIDMGILAGTRAIVAVASGKGGVGKSTTAVNIALGLAGRGKKVGVLDADIYGPSMPRMLGIKGRPDTNDGKTLEPMENHGLKVMSMGFLVDEDTPMIWRGPMVQSALEQMMRDVNWGELDVLIVDMPPGTGDAQLTMAQRVPLTGAVIVSTPQDLALLDARKGLNMFRKVDVPVFGIVENMSYFACPGCGHRTDIFGHGGAKQTAKELGVDFLGGIPLHLEIRETSDAGEPIVVSRPDGEHASAYKGVASKVSEKIEESIAAKTSSTPRIVME